MRARKYAPGFGSLIYFAVLIVIWTVTNLFDNPPFVTVVLLVTWFVGYFSRSEQEDREKKDRESDE